MSQFQRIKQVFDAAESEGGEASESLRTPRRRPPKARPVRGEILIAVMGVTGSGKSYFCRAATGDGKIKVGDGLESCNAADAPPLWNIY